MKLTRIGKTAATAVLAFLPLVTSAVAETQLRAISAWGESFTLVPHVFYAFEEAVTEASGGEITFSNVGPEAVPASEQLEPLSQGIFDVVFQSASYHQPQTGVALVIQNLLTADPEKLWSSGMIDHLNEYYRNKFGVIILARVNSGPTTFVLGSPLEGDTKLTGRKIRTTSSSEGTVRALDGVPVSMAVADAYVAMEKGAIDGMAFQAAFTAEYKLYEVAKYLTEPGFSQGGVLILMNAAKFDSLSPEMQEAIKKAGYDASIKGSDYVAEQVKAQTATMQEHGVQITAFNPEVQAQIKEIDFEAAKEVARRSQPDDVDAMIKFAEEKGLLVTQQ